MKHEQIEVMKQIIELSDTLEDGLAYMVRKIIAGKTESSLRMFNDILDAFEAIDKPFHNIMAEIPDEECKKSYQAINDKVITLLKAYEDEKSELYIIDILEKEMIPAYEKWSNNVKTLFNPYILV